MIIYKDKHKDKTVLELDENELTLLAYLIEKSSRKTREEKIINDPIDVRMNEVFRDFLEYE